MPIADRALTGLVIYRQGGSHKNRKHQSFVGLRRRCHSHCDVNTGQAVRPTADQMVQVVPPVPAYGPAGPPPRRREFARAPGPAFWRPLRAHAPRDCAEHFSAVFQSRMELPQKIKIALDETRILILGAQILLGFGFRGVFSERFDELPGYARCANGVGLGLLVCAIGLLIAPGPYHRIVEGGQDSGRLHRFATVIADLALLPFALALGLGLFVSIEAIFDISAVSIAAGMTGAGLALALWYGLPRLRERFAGERERMITRQSNERADTPLQAKIEQVLTEARVVLPGAQALFGFQLAIVLTRAFERLPKRPAFCWSRSPS